MLLAGPAGDAVTVHAGECSAKILYCTGFGDSLFDSVR